MTIEFLNNLVLSLIPGAVSDQDLLIREIHDNPQFRQPTTKPNQSPPQPAASQQPPPKSNDTDAPPHGATLHPSDPSTTSRIP